LQALNTHSGKAEGFEDFWQTHLTAATMISTVKGAMGDVFQLLLTILWLYTREAWLRHVVDALVATLHAAGAPQGGFRLGGVVAAAEGATGATPELPSALHLVAPLAEALAPFMQLVQSALCWFEEAGIRHSAVTYRPLSLPMLGLQRLVDRYVALRQAGDSATQQATESAGILSSRSSAWVALGAGTFFSSMSSRTEAVQRLMRTRCNVLLSVRPDEVDPCFPKHMSLRGSAVDDTLFSLDAVFRITRITRTVSLELSPEANVGNASRGSAARWPVMIIELAAGTRFLEAMELLEQRGDLGSGEFEVRLQEWVNEASAADRHDRLLAVGTLLGRCSLDGNESASRRAEMAGRLLAQAVDAAEECGDAEGMANALLAKARHALTRQGATAGGDRAGVEADCRKALSLLAKAVGEDHPVSIAARTDWRDLGVLH